MNLGKNILEQRKLKDVTQEELASELGVTAAAVSKWENGYTLPDILMLCALADYFSVTTDELLGRNEPAKFAVIAAQTMQLGHLIAQKAVDNGYTVHGIYEDFCQARGATVVHAEVTHLFAGYTTEIPDALTEDIPQTLHFCRSISDSEEKILAGFDVYFDNKKFFESISKNNHN